ncbi:hypothetical protein ABDM77_08395 [Mangrovibacter phragmitis]
MPSIAASATAYNESWPGNSTPEVIAEKSRLSILASQQNSYMTGTVIRVDGGLIPSI